MSMRTILSATLGGLILSAVICTAPVSAGEPLRVTPAVRQVEADAPTDDVTLTGWRHARFRARRFHRGFYRGYGRIGFFGHRRWGYGPVWSSYGYRPYVYSSPYYPAYPYRPYSYGYYATYRPVYPVPAYPTAAPAYPVYDYAAPVPVYAPRTYYTPAVYTGYCGGGYYWDSWR